MRERDDRSHDRGVVGPRYQLGDEPPVDLQLVDREASQVAHAGIAGAEVVDRYHHAHAAQLLENRHGFFRVAHQRALGDLDLEKARLELCSLQRLADHLQEVPLPELERRQVDRYAQRR